MFIYNNSINTDGTLRVYSIYFQLPVSDVYASRQVFIFHSSSSLFRGFNSVLDV